MKLGYWMLLFPVTVMAFVAPAIAYVNVIFTDTTRWAVVAALGLLLAGTGRIAVVFRNPVGLAALAYLTWCLLTILWSEVPELTVMKAGALALVIVSMLAGGHYWVTRFGWDRSLNYLYPILALALFAGAFGQAAIESTSDVLGLYEGLAGNPNMLGSLMNMSIPLLLWQCHRYRRRRAQLAIWLGILAVVIVVLLMSVSRAAILAAIVTSAAFLLSVGIKRNALLYTLAATVLIGVLAAVPGVYETLEQRYVRKVALDAEGDIFGSRQEVWEESYDLALKGGFVGGGYGVTIGETAFAGGFTAVGYGREKGSSQLAIMEETGIAGLTLYVLFLVALFRGATISLRQSIDRDMKVMSALVLGALAGLIVQSVFEAWWVAPGSAEAVYFWALCGVACGLRDEARKRVAAMKRAGAHAQWRPLTPTP